MIGYDAWQHVVQTRRLAESWPAIPRFDPLHPPGAGSSTELLGLFDALGLALAAGLELAGSTQALETSLAVLPPLLGVAACATIAASLAWQRGRWPAAGAVLGFIAFGGYHRYVTQLGFADHHALEALCLSGVLALGPVVQHSSAARVGLALTLVAWVAAWRGAALPILLLVGALWVCAAAGRLAQPPARPSEKLGVAWSLACAAALCGAVSAWLPDLFPNPRTGTAVALLLAGGATLSVLDGPSARIFPDRWLLDLWGLLGLALSLVLLPELRALAVDGLGLLVRPKTWSVAEHAVTSAGFATPSPLWAAAPVVLLGARALWREPAARPLALWGLALVGLVAWSHDYAYLLAPVLAWFSGHGLHLGLEGEGRPIALTVSCASLGTAVLMTTPGVDDALRRAHTDGHLGPEPAWFEVLPRLAPGTEPVLVPWDHGALARALTGRPVFAAGAPDRELAHLWVAPQESDSSLPADPHRAASHVVVEHSQLGADSWSPWTGPTVPSR